MTKITRDMVITAAFEVARKTGAENINARTAAKRLNCSTQPVMYHFATIEELKKTVYDKTNDYHSQYLMHISETQEAVMLGIGLNYIRFAVEEPNLFRFLFQSGFVAENNILEMIDSPELVSVLSVMQEEMGMDIEQTKEIFITLAIFVHGYASIIANNPLEYDEKLISTHMHNSTKTDKSTVLTVIGLIAMILLTITKITPSSQIAGYAVFVGIAFSFIVEAFEKTQDADSGLRFKTVPDDIKKPGVLLWTLLIGQIIIAAGNVSLVVYDVAAIFIDSMIYAIVYRRSGNCLTSLQGNAARQHPAIMRHLPSQQYTISQSFSYPFTPPSVTPAIMYFERNR